MHENAKPFADKALTENRENDLVCFLALLTEKDPDLAQVVDAWPKLPEHIKQTIKSLVKSWDSVK
jgi:succinate dehydrogenase flavin-adding protein (antitoxin of CptAB toxin-antitoxin module)